MCLYRIYPNMVFCFTEYIPRKHILQSKTPYYIGHDAFIRVKEHIRICDMTYSYGVATISRLLKKTGPFCRILSFYRALLQKRPMIWRSLLIEATPYAPAQYTICTIYYGVASTRRLLKIVGLFWKRTLQKRRYSAKETYDLIDPTDRSHPICVLCSA